MEEKKQKPSEQAIKNYNDAMDRLRQRYYDGHIDSKEYNRLAEWEMKNLESNGELYARKLEKALTPRECWHLR